MKQSAEKDQYSITEILKAVEALNADKKIFKKKKNEYTISEILEAVEALNEQD